MFAILAAFAVFTWLWRTLSPKLRELHKAADERAAIRRDAYAGKKVSVFQVLFGKDKKILLTYFISILVFYVGWNLLANTWGQFQTFMFVKADASQTLATGLGIVLNLVTLIINIVFASIAGGKYRNRAFFVGIGITFVAMVSLALGGTNLWIIVGAVAVMNLGSPLAGEAIYKVWTQESFPIEIRASMQGFINGFSRLVCGLFALVTPALVLPATIKTTMWGFAVIVIIEAVAGTIMIKSQKRYGTDEERIEASMSDKAFTAQSAQ